MTIREVEIRNVPETVTEEAFRNYLTNKGVVVKSVKANRPLRIIGAVLDVQFDAGMPPLDFGNGYWHELRR